MRILIGIKYFVFGFMLLSLLGANPFSQDKLINAFISIVQLTENLPQEIEDNCIDVANAFKDNSTLNTLDKSILILQLEQILLRSDTQFVLNADVVLKAKEDFPESDYESLKSRFVLYMNIVVFK